MGSNSKRTLSRSKVRKFIWGFWITYFLGLLMIILLFTSIGYGLFGKMPSFLELENPETNLASEIFSSDGKLLGKYYVENRSSIHYQDLGPNIVNALIATEDARFESHSGIDAKATGRMFYGILTGTDRGGGSTITQQLAKNLFPRKPRYTKLELGVMKLKEWVTAVKLERNYSKQEILAMYLNTVDFGSMSFGIKSAAKTFFNKTPDQLSPDEAAILVGILKAPSYFSPVRNPDRAWSRRNVVLKQMEKYGYISRLEYDTLRELPVDMSNYRIQDHTSGLATYFREYLRQFLTEWCNSHSKEDGTPYNMYRDGLRVYTTINSTMQGYAEQAVREYIGDELQPSFFHHWKGYSDAPFVFEEEEKKEIFKLMTSAMRRTDRYYRLKKDNYTEEEIFQNFKQPVKMKVFSYHGSIDTVLTPWDSIRYYKFFLQAGLLSIDPHTGYIKAYVGGIDNKYFQYDHVMVSKRQVGSTFKPFLYTLAIQEGETPCSMYPNVRPVIELYNGEKWSPDNSGSARVGEEVSLKWALANSNNWISGHLMKKYSPQEVINIARKMGVVSYIPPVYSIALGSADLSLYEMVGAMSTFANQGQWIEPIFITRIEDKYGNVIEHFIPQRQEAISEKTAYLMIELLKGVVESGTSVRLKYKYGFTNQIAGKTGTTQNQSDGWFMGITPDLVTGVWVGCEDRAAHFRTLTLGQGANMALPVWANYMTNVYADSVTTGITKRAFDKPLFKVDVTFNCDSLQQIIKMTEKDKFDEF